MSKRRSWVGLAILFAVALGVAVVVAQRGERGADEPRAERRSSVLPAPKGSTKQTLDYVNGAGAALLVMHDTAASLAEKTDPKVCRKTIASLDQAVTGEEAAALIADVPEDVLRAVFDSERQALGIRLTACVEASAQPAEQNELAATLSRASALVKGRLEQIGWKR